MSSDNWKTATSYRDRKRSGRYGDSHKNIQGASYELSAVHTSPNVNDNDIVTNVLDIPVAMPAPQDTKISWADASESPDVSNIITAFMTEVGARCSNFGERASFVALTASSILDIGIKMIQDERNRIDASHNEKEFVRDLCNICTHGKKLIDTTIEVVSIIKKHVATYESEKNSALDGLKTFLASIDQTMVPVDPAPAMSSRYASVVSGTREQTLAKKSAGQQLMASVPLGPGQMVLPMIRGCDQSRNRIDVMPMSINYASDLGVFLINIDGKLYSFCNGVFISRLSKTGDNTLYGKRCNPTTTRCIGANCTYYHDPLTHATGHTMRNMGVHYVISELINGVANDAEIAETARGKNKYIVEDIVSLAGMLLIKAFQVKKIRDQYTA
jgi:hypothetical protein